MRVAIIGSRRYENKKKIKDFVKKLVNGVNLIKRNIAMWG